MEMLRKEKFGKRKQLELCIKSDNNKEIFLFRFLYFGGQFGIENADLTHCTLMIHVLSKDNRGVYVTAITGEAKRHPKDSPNWRIGARTAAKRAIYGLSEESMSLCQTTKRELYNAVRYAIPIK